MDSLCLIEAFRLYDMRCRRQARSRTVISSNRTEFSTFLIRFNREGTIARFILAASHIIEM